MPRWFLIMSSPVELNRPSFSLNRSQPQNKVHAHLSGPRFLLSVWDVGLILWSVLRLRPDTQSSWVFVSHCGLGSCVWMCKRSSNGFRISSLKPLSDSTEGRTKTTHTYTFSFSYHSHLLFPIASNTENIWYNYHLAN